MVQSILAMIEWVLVPLILFLLFGYGFQILPNQVKSEQLRKGARAARWAGLLLLVLFVISRKGQHDALVLTFPTYRFNFPLTVVGIPVGFCFSWLIERVKRNRLLSLVVLVLVSAMAITFYSYFFIYVTRILILFLVLGFAFGFLIDKSFSRHWFNPSQKTDSNK